MKTFTPIKFIRTETIDGHSVEVPYNTNQVIVDKFGYVYATPSEGMIYLVGQYPNAIMLDRSGTCEFTLVGKFEPEFTIKYFGLNIPPNGLDWIFMNKAGKVFMSKEFLYSILEKRNS